MKKEDKDLMASIATSLIVLVALLMIVIACSSCNRKAYALESNTSVSTYIVDTIVRVEPDSSLVRALMECDSNNQVVMRSLSEVKGATAKTDVQFENNEIRLETRWKTHYTTRYVHVHDTVRIKVDKIIEKPVPVKHIPAFFWGCFAVALIAVGWQIVKILKKFKVI